MIRIFNPDRLTRQPFFQALIAYLDQEEEVILRQIKKEFSDFPHLDRRLEQYIQAGYISRKEKRYRLTLPFVEQVDDLDLDELVFIREEDGLYQDLQALRFETRLGNVTNQAMIFEKTSFAREELTLSNYFYRLEKGYPLSDAQQALYAILGDVNPEYALKYMTTFLLKFTRKEKVLQKRPDIFVQALECLGYIDKKEGDYYGLRLQLDPERLQFSVE